MVLINIAAVADQRGRTREALDLVDGAENLFATLSASLGANENFQGHRSKYERLRELIRRHLDSATSRTNPSKDACIQAVLFVNLLTK